MGTKRPGNGGVRPGAGRKDGSKNKATIERELLAERIMAEQKQKPGRKLAKEILDDFMHLAMGLAAQYQPLPYGVAVAPGQTPDEEKFFKYATMAGDFAGKLVKYQSPTMGLMKVSIEPRFPSGAEGADQVALPSPGQVEKLTPSQAYRLLRDSDLIDIEPGSAPAAKSKKAASA